MQMRTQRRKKMSGRMGKGEEEEEGVRRKGGGISWESPERKIVTVRKSRDIGRNWKGKLIFWGLRSGRKSSLIEFGWCSCKHSFTH